MAQESSGYVDTGSGRIYYETAGEGAPVVLVHAGFLDRGMWDEQWPVLSRQFSVLRFDLLGFGKSDAPAQPVLSHRRQLYQVLEQAGVTQAVLIGCSLGGEIVLDAALERPGLASGLVVVSAAPGGFELQGEPPRPLVEMMDFLERGNLKDASEMQMRLWVDGPKRRPAEVDPRVRQRAALMNRNALEKGPWNLAAAEAAEPLDPPAMARLGEIGVPALIVAGELDDPELLRAADAMAGAIPKARKAIIAGAAHVPNMEQPEEFNRVMLDFLGWAAK